MHKNIYLSLYLFVLNLNNFQHQYNLSAILGDQHFGTNTITGSDKYLHHHKSLRIKMFVIDVINVAWVSIELPTKRSHGGGSHTPCMMVCKHFCCRSVWKIYTVVTWYYQISVSIEYICIQRHAWLWIVTDCFPLPIALNNAPAMTY